MPDYHNYLNFYHIFFNNYSPLFFVFEVVFRTTVMYLYTLINIRFMGKRSMRQLTPFEFIIVIALGSSVGDPMFYPNVPLLHGMLVITMIVLLQHSLSLITEKYPRIEQIIEGKPTLLIEKGKINKKNLIKEKVAKNELFSWLRCKGIKNTGEVEYAYLETTGELSIIKGEAIHNGESTLLNNNLHHFD